MMPSTGARGCLSVAGSTIALGSVSTGPTDFLSGVPATRGADVGSDWGVWAHLGCSGLTRVSGARGSVLAAGAGLRVTTCVPDAG